MAFISGWKFAPWYRVTEMATKQSLSTEENYANWLKAEEKVSGP